VSPLPLQGDIAGEHISAGFVEEEGVDSLQHLRGRPVLLTYQGMRYQGRLLGVGTDDVLLETWNGRLTLPMSGISSMLPLPAQKVP